MESGYIRKCFEEDIDGITVNDDLHKALIDKDGELYDVLSTEQRAELIVEIFTQFVIGGTSLLPFCCCCCVCCVVRLFLAGSLCQYEDTVRYSAFSSFVA